MAWKNRFTHESHGWFMQRLGEEPLLEAEDLQVLCGRAQSDSEVVAEFGSTVEKYSGGTIESVAQLITDRYCGPESDKRIAAILYVLSEPVGMACFGMADYEVEGGIKGSGLNLGCWLLKDYRGYGLGAWAMETLSREVNQKRRDPSHPLYKVPQWTAIRIGNVASEHMLLTTNASVETIGKDASNPMYRIFSLRKAVQ